MGSLRRARPAWSVSMEELTARGSSGASGARVPTPRTPKQEFEALPRLPVKAVSIVWERTQSRSLAGDAARHCTRAVGRSGESGANAQHLAVQEPFERDHAS